MNTDSLTGSQVLFIAAVFVLLSFAVSTLIGKMIGHGQASGGEVPTPPELKPLFRAPYGELTYLETRPNGDRVYFAQDDLGTYIFVDTSKRED